MQSLLQKISCSKTALQRHRESAHYKQAFPNPSNQVSIQVSLQKQENTSSYRETTTVQLAAFIAEHNLPLTISPFLLDLLKSRAPQNIQEAKSLQEMKLGSTKCTNIIRQGVGLFYAKELVEILRASFITKTFHVSGSDCRLLKRRQYFMQICFIVNYSFERE